MTTADAFREFVRSTLRLSTLAADAAMGQVRGWDSLDHVDLIVALQEQYGVQIPADLIGELTSLPALLEFMRTQGAIAD